MSTDSISSDAPHKLRVMHAVLLLVGSCLPILGAVLLAPLLPQMAQHFAAVPHAGVLVPLVLTMPALMVGLLGPSAGFVVDRFGRKVPLIVALLCYSALGTAPLWLDNLYGVLASRFGLGIVEAIIITCFTALIGDYYADQQRERMLAWQTMTGSLSAALFFVVGGALGELGWRTPFWLYVVGALMAPCVALMLWEPIQRTPSGADVSRHVTRFPWRHNVWLYVLTWCAGMALFIVAVQLGFMLAGIGVHAPKLIGIAIGASHTAVLCGAICSRWFGRLGRVRVLCVAFALAGASLVLLGSASSYSQAVLAVLLNGFGSGLMIPTLASWALANLPVALRGRGSGGFMASFYLGEFMSPLVVVAVTSLTGGLVPAVRTLGVVLVVVALACAVQWVMQRRAAPVEA
ncbi:MFS transporter [Paraburkholderia sp.]|uniref:MFS transporter n=1 Tax=Paraburkholderia sp. TaxID=1926495 RepID=UPI003C7EA391